MTAVLVIASTVVVLDQITKYIALDRLTLGVPVPVVEGFLNLTLVMNPGLAFGMLGGVPPRWWWAVAILSIAALVILARLAVRVIPEGGALGRIALGLIFGGAVGNLMDRWFHGAVVDFVDVYWRDFHWWAFNVADSGISVGVALLAVQLFISDRRSG